MNEMFYLTMPLTHSIHGYMASDIWFKTTQIMRGNLHQIGIFYTYHPTDKIPWLLVHQLWRTGWNEKYLGGSTKKD